MDWELRTLFLVSLEIRHTLMINMWTPKANFLVFKVTPHQTLIKTSFDPLAAGL